ncbi:MAG: hypothetical protein II189_09090, partial [Lachnospiraceae bacterium]|nr:hypothetical protein [Lachnospiraceae bacterium]MBQ4303200.1 hypothetical protein [Lachnospiraceae bacterium]
GALTVIVKESAYTKRSPRKEPDLYDAEQSISTGTDRIKIHLPEVQSTGADGRYKPLYDAVR